MPSTEISSYFFASNHRKSAFSYPTNSHRIQFATVQIPRPNSIWSDDATHWNRSPNSMHLDYESVSARVKINFNVAHFEFDWRFTDSPRVRDVDFQYENVAPSVETVGRASWRLENWGYYRSMYGVGTHVKIWCIAPSVFGSIW